MAKIMVYDPDTNQIYTEWREENDPMPYSYGRTLLVREFRGSSRSTVFWTTTTAMEAWNATRRTYGAAIPVEMCIRDRGCQTSLSRRTRTSICRRNAACTSI